jgi:uncharacterized protein (TIGR00369 family)
VATHSAMLLLPRGLARGVRLGLFDEAAVFGRRGLASSKRGALDPAVEQIVRRSFKAQGLMTALSARIDRLEAGVCSVSIPASDLSTQQHGAFHGGVTASIADTAAGYAALSLMPLGSDVLATEFKLNLLAPALGDRLVAEAQVLKAGRTLTVSRVEVYAERAIPPERSEGGGVVPTTAAEESRLTRVLCGAMLQSSIRLSERRPHLNDHDEA